MCNSACSPACDGCNNGPGANQCQQCALGFYDNSGICAGNINSNLSTANCSCMIQYL